jgi:hypothetical protein
MARPIAFALEAVITASTPTIAVVGAAGAVLAHVADAIATVQGDARILVLVACGALGARIAGAGAGVAYFVADLGAVAEQPIVATVGRCAGLANVALTGFRPVAVEPITAVSVRRAAHGLEAEIRHAESQVVLMSFVGDPEGAVTAWASTAPAVLAEVGLLGIIPADEQHGVSSQVAAA